MRGLPDDPFPSVSATLAEARAHVPTPQEHGPTNPDVVGSIAIPDDDGTPTGVSVLLTRGMDPAGLAETFTAQRRVDLDGGALIRRPGVST